jgi:hypothetical protein
MADDTLPLIQAAEDAMRAGKFDIANEIALTIKQKQMAREPLPQYPLGQEGMPQAIKSVASQSGVANQRLAGLGSAPMIAGNAIAQLAGAKNAPDIQNWQAVAHATPDTTMGNIAGNALTFGAIPAGAVGAGMRMAGRSIPRLGAAADVAATQGGIAAATTPGDTGDRLLAGAFGAGAGVLPGGVSAVQGGRRVITKEGNRLGIAEGLRRELGPEAEGLTTALEGKYPGEAYGVRPTAAMLTRNPVLETMETGSRVRTGDQWTQFDRMNAAARWKALEDAAGTPQELEKLRAARDAITTPKREGALAAANRRGIEVPALQSKLESQLQSRLDSEKEAMVSALRDAGRFETTAAQMEHRGANFSPVEGMPRVSGRISDFPDRVAEAQKAAKDARAVYEARRAQVAATERQLEILGGHKTTSMQESIQPLTSKLEQLSTGGDRPNKDVQTLVGYVKGELDKGATPDQLYTIRKMLTDGIKAGPTSELSQAARAARPQRMQIIGEIDNALNDMSGGKWQDYLESYKISSPLINSRQALTNITDALKSGRPVGEIPASLGERPAPSAFGRLLERHGTKEFGSKEIDQLIPQHRELANTLLSDLNTQQGVMLPRGMLGSPTAPNMANAGRVNQLTNSLVDAAGSVIPYAGGVVAANVKGGMARKQEEALAELLKDPKQLAEALRKAKISADLLRQSGQAGAGISAATRTGE